MGIINFLIIKTLVKTKYANIINIAAQEEIIPELLQSNCNSHNIFKVVSNLLENPDKVRNQVDRTQIIIKKLRTEKSSAESAAKSISSFL